MEVRSASSTVQGFVTNWVFGHARVQSATVSRNPTPISRSINEIIDVVIHFIFIQQKDEKSRCFHFSIFFSIDAHTMSMTKQVTCL